MHRQRCSRPRWHRGWRARRRGAHSQIYKPGHFAKECPEKEKPNVVAVQPQDKVKSTRVTVVDIEKVTMLVAPDWLANISTFKTKEHEDNMLILHMIFFEMCGCGTIVESRPRADHFSPQVKIQSWIDALKI